MADLSITAASVMAAAGATTSNVTAGATITAGQLVYLDTADSEYKLVDNDAAGTATVAGISLNGASDGQPLSILVAGNIDVGATLTQGEVYCASSTAGGIAPDADNVTGDFRSVLGVATTTSNLLVSIINSGVAIP